jgi:beta-lactamase regulating signal transducer with metallopeptidase domain
VNEFAEAFAWCILQVTLFSFVAACLYGLVVRFRLGGGGTVLISSLAIVGLLTLLCVSPWPQWLTPAEVAELNPISPDVTTTPPAQHVISTDRSLVAAATKQGNQTKTLLERWAPISAASRKSEFSDGLGAEDRHAAMLETSKNHGAERAHSISFGRFEVWSTSLASLAVIAAVIGLIRFLAGMISVWSYRRTSIPIEGCELGNLLAEFGDSLALRRAVSARESRSLQVAATSGWLRPIILLPGTWREWTPHQLRAVLLHELAHISQQHFPVWILGQLPLVAHYYHPLVHWLVRRLRLEQELAADALAAQWFGGQRQYATVLAGLALGAPKPRGPFAQLGLFMSRPFLMRRLAMLRQTGGTRIRTSRKTQAALFIPLGLAAAVVAGLRTSAAEENNQPAATATTTAEEPEIGPQSTRASAAEAAKTIATPGTLNPGYYSGGSPRGPSALALFEVSRTPPSLANTESEPDSDAAWQVLCKTQLAKLRSYYVLQAAVRNPEIASLPLLREKQDPVAWLAESLDVGFHPGSELMYVRLYGKPGEEEQLRKLVDAVSRAYEDEVLYAQSQAILRKRDLLAAQLNKLENELTNKTNLYYGLEEETGAADTGSGRVAQELDMKRLDRIEDELMRLENAQLELETSGQPGNTKFYEVRIDQLRKRQAELEHSIRERSQSSVELTTRLREIERLQRVYIEMSTKLEVMDVEANAPARIRKLQEAVVAARKPSSPNPSN